jgi:hypothetical protein
MDACEMPLQNAGRKEIQEILATARTVTMVGLPAKPHRDSYQVQPVEQLFSFQAFKARWMGMLANDVTGHAV